MTLSAFIVVFCRVVIILVFSMSFIGKMSDITAFQTAITNFNILSPKWSKRAAWAFLGGEFVVVALLIWGGKNILLTGFLVAVILLVTFTTALGIALIQQVRVSCNCFGREEKPISPYDLVRNGGFIVCSLISIGLLWTNHELMLDIPNFVLAGLMGSVFVMVLTNLSEIIKLYNQPKNLG